MNAIRLPNKPLKLINNKEMILHVYEAAMKADAGEVYVATPDKKIIDTVKKIGGNAILTAENHQTGTDRVFEVFKKNLNANPNIIVNLQGDMPNISPETINNLVDYMNKGHCEIGTLASKLSSNEELDDENVVKVLVKEKLKTGMYVKAVDFVRLKNIQELQKTTGCTLVINEDPVTEEGIVEILGTDQEGIDKVIASIESMLFKPEVGSVYEVKVIKILDFGAVVEYQEAPGNEVLLHISELDWKKTEKVTDVLNMGDILDVKYFGVDPRTRKDKVSRKALIEKPEGYVERPPRPPRSNDRGRDNRGRDNRNRR